LTQQRIEHSRFTYIRFSDNGNKSAFKARIHAANIGNRGHNHAYDCKPSAFLTVVSVYKYL
jgi:hypothetical protein